MSESVTADEIRLQPPHRVYLWRNQVRTDMDTRGQIFNDEIVDYLDYGIIMTFTYTIKFYKKNFLVDDELSEITIRRRVYRDLWTEKYHLLSDYPRKKSYVYDDITALKNNILKLRGIFVYDKALIDPDSDYYFRTRLTLKITKLKSYFQIIYNMLSLFRYKSTFLESDAIRGADILEPPTD